MTTLQETITTVLQSYFKDYMEHMRDHYTKRWNYCWSHKEEWLERRHSLQVTPTASMAEFRKNQFAAKEYSKKLMDKSLSYSRIEDYLECYIKPHAEAYWEQSIRTLSDKVEKFNLDEPTIRITEPKTTSSGFETMLTDGNNRHVYARQIWAAENSPFMRPHFRYIVTERHQ